MESKVMKNMMLFTSGHCDYSLLFYSSLCHPLPRRKVKIDRYLLLNIWWSWSLFTGTGYIPRSLNRGIGLDLLRLFGILCWKLRQFIRQHVDRSGIGDVVVFRLFVLDGRPKMYFWCFYWGWKVLLRLAGKRFFTLVEHETSARIREGRFTVKDFIFHHEASTLRSLDLHLILSRWNGLTHVHNALPYIGLPSCHWELR